MGRGTRHAAAPAVPENALERAFPGLRGSLPRFPLTRLPTPVARLEALETHSGAAALWVKRDDRSGAVYGGNKPRKLEYILGEAVARGCRTVLTFGGIGTHHGLAAALAAREAGLACRLVLVPQPVTPHVRRMLLLQHLAGAQLHLARSPLSAARVGAHLWVSERLAGRRPCVVFVGGSSPTGALGMVDAALELAEQVRAGLLPEPDWIFTALGSGGTAAGIALGLRLAGLRTRVAAVLVTDILPPRLPRLVRLARRTAGRLRQAVGSEIPAAGISAADVCVLEGWVGRGYGDPTPEAERACRLARDLEGIALEPTYTGKAMAALISESHREPFRGRTLLFWNTYSSVDPSGGKPLPDPRSLPAEFGRFFDGPVEAASGDP